MVRRMLAVAVVVAALALGACTTSDTPSGGLTATVASDETARKIADVVNQKMAEWNMRAVILKVTKGDETIAKQAFGPSMDGVPATTEHELPQRRRRVLLRQHLLLRYVDDGTVKLDDPIVQWEPTLPNADKVTLRMLANQTTGYPDYETDPGLARGVQRQPVPHLHVRGTAEVCVRPARCSSPRVRTGATRIRTS